MNLKTILAIDFILAAIVMAALLPKSHNVHIKIEIKYEQLRP
jgi:hypothetical protein